MGGVLNVVQKQVSICIRKPSLWNKWKKRQGIKSSPLVPALWIQICKEKYAKERMMNLSKLIHLKTIRSKTNFVTLTQLLMFYITYCMMMNNLRMERFIDCTIMYKRSEEHTYELQSRFDIV